MRRPLLLLAFVFACSKSETPKPDDTASAPPAAGLTEADVAGTWKGGSMLMGSDSVAFHWTQICGGGTCKGIIDGTTDTLTSTYTIAGDSTVGVSAPATVPAIKAGPVIDHWVVHLVNGKASGTGHMNLASKPDSVVMAYHFTGSRTP